MKKNTFGHFKVTKPVSAKLKEAILDHVKEEKKANKRGSTTNAVIIALESMADRKATTNAIKTLVNEKKLNISTARRPKNHPGVKKPFEERVVNLPVRDGRFGRPKQKEDAAIENEDK